MSVQTKHTTPLGGNGRCNVIRASNGAISEKNMAQDLLVKMLVPTIGLASDTPSNGFDSISIQVKALIVFFHNYTKLAMLPF